MIVMSRLTLLLFVLLALGLVSPASLRAWQLEDLAWRRVAVPPVLRAIDVETSADFDNDGLPETLLLTGDRAAIAAGKRIRWQSPEAWQVKQAQITDLNRDGFPEATLLVWRQFRPWPVDTWLPHGGRIADFHDSDGMSCHVILIGWKQGSFWELWAGSAMAQPLDRFAAVDLTGNGRQNLVVLEGEYDDPPSAPAHRLMVWEWNGFGFAVVNELDGSFNLLVPARMEDGRALILTD